MRRRSCAQEAQQLLAEFQKKRKEAEKEAADMVAAAKRESDLIIEDAHKKTEEYVARRAALAELKIGQAERDAVNEVRSIAVDVATEAARAVLAGKARRQGQRRAVQGFADGGPDQAELKFSASSAPSLLGRTSPPQGEMATDAFAFNVAISAVVDRRSPPLREMSGRTEGGNVERCRAQNYSRRRNRLASSCDLRPPRAGTARR